MCSKVGCGMGRACVIPELVRDSKPRSHIYQVGKRGGFHLAHHAASVRLHGNLADAQLEANLLVQKTTDHQRHDLLLATAQ